MLGRICDKEGGSNSLVFFLLQVQKVGVPGKTSVCAGPQAVPLHLMLKSLSGPLILPRFGHLMCVKSLTH